MTIPAVSKSDEGLYKCHNSDLGESPQSWLAVGGISPPASLSVSPDRSQFFEYESVSLSCEEQQGSSTEWRVKRFSAIGTLSGSFIRVGPDRSQFFKYETVSLLCYSGVYWCESDSGEHSDAVNITVTEGAVILESPVHPVTEGDAVTLRCRKKTTPSKLTANFYKDGSLIRTASTGEMIIPAVSKSDEGLYKCHNSDREESPQSWLAVRAFLPSFPSHFPFTMFFCFVFQRDLYRNQSQSTQL
ncbi:Fc receptor-like protein 5 [Aplochiton taeniatus]